MEEKTVSADMKKQVDEILYLSEFHGFDIEAQYPDGETVKEKAVTIEELDKILYEVLLDKENTEYTINIGNLQITGSAEDIHQLATIYGLASCEYGHQIIDEIHDKHNKSYIDELVNERKELDKIEKQLIDTIRNSDYYKEYSSNMSNMIDSIIKEIQNDECRIEER